MQKNPQQAAVRRLKPSLMSIALLSALCTPALQAQTTPMETQPGLGASQPSASTTAPKTTDAATNKLRVQNKVPPANTSKATTLNEVKVTGLLSSIESSISKKRDATVVSDVLSSSDIGDLPAQSIGDAIETITGAATHRDKGAATEISIRGLGPYLGAATFNGREVTNGSGDRSVNFQMYPSEVINTVAIYKTQRADFIEGGISGIINLETVKPLTFDKRRVQVDVQGSSSGDDSKLKDNYGIGSRATFSYLDQFNLGDAGKLGVSLGLQRERTDDPQDTLTSSTTVGACDTSATSSGKCPSVTAEQVAAGTPYYLIPGSRTYRQMNTTDKRDAVFGSLQWQPSDTLEFDLDYEGSKRDFVEDRHDLNLSEASTAVTNVMARNDGALQSYTGSSALESNSDYYTRNEDYKGGGFTVNWTPNQSWLVSGDLSYAHTLRTQLELNTRLRSSKTDINGDPVAGVTGSRAVDYTYDYAGDVPSINFNPLFDFNNWDNFSGVPRLRRTETQRRETIRAARLDTSFFPESGFLTTIKGGVRASELSYNDFTNRTEFNYSDPALIQQASNSCRRPFPESNYLSGATGNTVDSWATFDSRCLFQAFTGVADTGLPSDVQDPANNDVTEKTQAAYLMAEFSSQAFGLPVTGNFGVRWVHTHDSSVGLRSDLAVVNNPDGSIQLVPTGGFTAQNISASNNVFLPSVNASFALNEDTQLRLGLYRAMSRPDPDYLGAGRTITLADGTSFTNVADAIKNITATGNPRAKPLLSWNADLSLEWYPDPTSLLSAAVYFKRFNGATISTVINEPFVIDGSTVSVPVVQPTTSSQKSDLAGLELNASHRFSSLPAPFDGLGVKVGYNYNWSNYKTEDLLLGAQVDPSTGQTTPGIVSPLGMYGLSRNVLSTSLYYTFGPVDLQTIYNYRSAYFQQFVGDPHQNRVIQGNGTLSFRASWRVNKHLSFSLQGSNLTNEKKVAYMPIEGSFQEYDSYGRQYYVSARYRF